MTKGPKIWAPPSASPDLTSLRRLIRRGLALAISSLPTAPADLSAFTFQPAPDPAAVSPSSGRPGHLAARLLDRACHLGAVDHGGDVEEIVRRRSLRLGVADKKGGEQLVLVRAIEGLVRPERDLGRKLIILQRLGHVDGFERF